MRTLSILKFHNISFILMSLLLVLGCQNNESELKEANYSNDPNIFIDTFSAGLNYAAFGGSVATGFQVDKEVSYNKSAAAMRFDVPNVNDPYGSYVGGSFFTTVGRDLTGYDCLTFWAKSSQSASIDVVGFGNDFGLNKYQTSISGLVVSTVWKKYIIPIPNPLNLKIEKGMLFISEGPENEKGYSFWLDEVKFEKLGTISHSQGSILNGEDKVESSFIGITKNIDGLISTFNLPNGVNQSANITPAYFVFSSSDPAVATVDEAGKVTTIGDGTAIITAKLGDAVAKGSLTINSKGTYIHAPIPTHDASKVISIYTEQYPNVPVDYYNGYWEPYQTTKSADFTVNNDNVLNYTNFNFVGIQFSTPTINVSNMTHLNINLFMPNAIASGSTFKIEVVDFGADGVSGGTDNTKAVTDVSTSIVSQSWINLKIPISSLTGLASKNHIGQIIFSGTAITNFYADNIYFSN